MRKLKHNIGARRRFKVNNIGIYYNMRLNVVGACAADPAVIALLKCVARSLT